MDCPLILLLLRPHFHYAKQASFLFLLLEFSTTKNTILAAGRIGERGIVNEMPKSGAFNFACWRGHDDEDDDGTEE